MGQDHPRQRENPSERRDREVRNVFVVDRVKCDGFHEVAKVRRFHNEHPVFVQEGCSPADEVHDVRDVGQDVRADDNDAGPSSALMPGSRLAEEVG